MAGAIRNQFNLVGNTVNNGTTGGVEGGGATGGGSTGADSATVQTAIAKDAKDWTLDEQKAVAEDIAAKGEASPAYAKAKAAMDAGTSWSVKMTNGETMTYRIIGINHDNLADGSGKAGLTFWTTSTGIKSRMNARNADTGGWEASELRMKMNSGEIWSLMPTDLQSKVKAVKKLTNNVGGGYDNRDAAVTATTDKLFLLSSSEIVKIPSNTKPNGYSWICTWLSEEGTPYEAFKDKVTEMNNGNSAIAVDDINVARWQRTVYPSDDVTDPTRPVRFRFIDDRGDSSSYNVAVCVFNVCPAWCF